MIKKHAIKRTGRFLFIYLVYVFVLSCCLLAHSFATGKRMNMQANACSQATANKAMEVNENTYELPAFWLLHAWMF